MARTSKRRTSKQSYLKGRARKGSLSYGPVKAREIKGAHPVFGSGFSGRVEVERGAGVVELPLPTQFRRIAAQEGIPPQAVDKAFGHMNGMKKPATKARRTSRKRRSSRGVKKNPRRKRDIRHGFLHSDQTTAGEIVDFTAREYIIAPEDVKRFGHTIGILVDVGGRAKLVTARDAQRVAYPWFDKEDFQKAFGHVLRKKAVPKTSSRRLPTVYGPRSMRLGYWSALDLDESGAPVHAPDSAPHIGAQPGQLILLHKPSHSVVWQALFDPLAEGEKFIRIIAPGERLKGFKEGKGHVEFGRALKMAQDRNIPPIAFLDAFGFTVDKRALKDLYRDFIREAKDKKRQRK